MSPALRDLRSWPSGRQWLGCGLATAVLLAIAWLILPDFVDLSHRPSALQMVKIGAVAFLFPALIEELVFRGLLNPKQTPLSIGLSTALFVLWHPIAGYFLIPEAFPFVSDFRFLCFAALFGLTFCLMRRITGSLWAPILCHWIVTLTWKALGGARFLTD
tara:strand:+ start:1216 stop:1695 length:480 start_codon:yes stop_codon:yes gene_type:complete